ncbi:hypothetical protein SDC9_155072 [bioreactor metagenome]|uniref:Uncharacterized protein n=1 Tax=bioreactor metagenome TaxID=1076179 RepID=A0A645F207_9ZZZZ
MADAADGYFWDIKIQKFLIVPVPDPADIGSVCRPVIQDGDDAEWFIFVMQKVDDLIQADRIFDQVQDDILVVDGDRFLTAEFLLGRRETGLDLFGGQAEMFAY